MSPGVVNSSVLKDTHSLTSCQYGNIKIQKRLRRLNSWCRRALWVLKRTRIQINISAPQPGHHKKFVFMDHCVGVCASGSQQHSLLLHHCAAGADNSNHFNDICAERRRMLFVCLCCAPNGLSSVKQNNVILRIIYFGCPHIPAVSSFCCHRDDDCERCLRFAGAIFKVCSLIL